MKGKFKYVLIFLIVGFLFFAGFISRFSELIFISHSYLFALIILVLFVIFSLWMIITKQTINKETFNPLIWITLGVFVILIITSQVKYDSIFETYRIATPILLFIMLINLVRDQRDWKICVYALLSFGLSIGVVSYIGFYTGSGFGTYALTSRWGYQNTFAAFLVLMIQLSLGLFFDEANHNLKMLLSTIPIFFIFLLFLTVSRGGYIALIASIIVFLIAAPKREFRKILKEFLPVLAVSILLILVGSPKEIIMANLGKGTVLVNFIGGAQDYSLGMRVYMMRLASEIFLKRPIFGFGLGTFRYTFAKYNTRDLFFRIDPHSLFFKFLAETGIIGTAAFFSMVGYYLVKSLKFIQSEKTNYTYIGLFAGLTGMLLHMCIDVDIYPVMFVVLFFALALLVKNEFIEFKIKPKIITAILSAILILIISFDLVPKTIASIYAVRGEVPHSLKELETSITYMEKATKIDEKSPQYQFMLGELIAKSMASSNDAEKIIRMKEAYKKAYELNKLDCRAPFRIGMILLSDRDPHAITYLETAKELYPMDPNVLSWLSVAYAYINKDINNSERCLEEAKKFSVPASVIIFTNEEAERYLAPELDPVFAKGVLALAEGDREEAEKNFSTLSFYDEIYKELDIIPRNYAQGRYMLQLKIIKDMMSELEEN